MKISAVIVSRNDNYGGNLVERATYCINSAINTYDEVFYIDWNSPKKSLLYELKDNIKFKGNLHHYVINPEMASLLTNYDTNAQVCCETLARNIGIRRATGDWTVSTNIDVIQPIREELESLINTSDENTFYTISRRPIELSDIKKFHNGDCKYEDWESLRRYLVENSEERHYEEKVNDGDDYSLINCCGDFQIAPKGIWQDICGFEEDLIYVLYSDTNVQKKAVMHGFNLKAIYTPALFHINHGRGGGGFLDGINRVTNNPQRAIIEQQKTRNLDSWGCIGIDFEYEII